MSQINLGNLPTLIKCLWPPSHDMFSGLGREVLREHWVQAVTPPAPPNAVALLCMCGWHHIIREDALRWAYGRREIEKLLSPYEEHMRAVRALYDPSLAELTDWGWFHTEAGA